MQNAPRMHLREGRSEWNGATPSAQGAFFTVATTAYLGGEQANETPGTAPREPKP